MARTKKFKSRPFHERFNIQLDMKEVEIYFVNRVISLVFFDYVDTKLLSLRKKIYLNVAAALGEIYISHIITDYVYGDFYSCLRAVEAAYATLPQGPREELDDLICSILDRSEIDLGITWKKGMFIRTGATLLDQNLVNEPLEWLSDPKYKDVYVPFERGLNHFLKAGKYPDLLPDVIKNVYEALEALSKIITGRHSKDLSANAELFIKKIRASESYKRLLKEYIDYANRFRHAPREGEKKPEPSESEVESFIYLTGLFIRLAIKSKATNDLSSKPSG